MENTIKPQINHVYKLITMTNARKQLLKAVKTTIPFNCSGFCCSDNGARGAEDRGGACERGGRGSLRRGCCWEGNCWLGPHGGGLLLSTGPLRSLFFSADDDEPIDLRGSFTAKHMGEGELYNGC